MQSFIYVVLRDLQNTISVQTKERVDVSALHLSELSFIVPCNKRVEFVSF